MTSALRIGVVGTGFARTTQIPAFQACEGVSVVALATSGRPERAEDAARALGIPHVCEDWRALVARPDVDLVSIVTPPALHAPIALAALEAGKSVLCEKPTAMNAGEAEAMWQAARRSGGLALLDHELRFLPSRRRMRDGIQDGELGAIRHVRFTYRADARALPSRPWDWWSDQAQGGGVLGAIGSHAVDSLRWLLQREPRELVGTLTTHVAERSGRPVTADDEALVLLRWPEGITGQVSLSVVEAGPMGHVVEVFGSKAAFRAQGTTLAKAVLGQGRWEPVETGPLLPLAPGMPENEWARGFLFYARAIARGLQRGEAQVEGAATFEDGWRNQVVLDAVHTSNARKAWVSLAGGL